MEDPKIRRKPIGLYVVIGAFCLLMIALGIGWYTTFDLLQAVQNDLVFQQQETRKYVQLSDQYELALDSKSAQLDESRAKLSSTEDNLENMTSLYESTSADLSTVRSDLRNTTEDLEQTRAELQLYKDTWGSVVASGIKPPFLNVNIIERTNAADTNWAEVQSFILADRTDSNTYDLDSYVCGDFASDVHNHAEAAGIRCALVAVEFKDMWHACNAFMTTDRGLVFIDCTGVESGIRPSSCDKLVNVKLGNDYIPVSMFPEPGWQTTWENVGKILDVQVYW